MTVKHSNLSKIEHFYFPLTILCIKLTGNINYDIISTLIQYSHKRENVRCD